MEKVNMTIAHNSKGGKVITLKEVPAAPKFMSETAQKYFTAMGENWLRSTDCEIRSLKLWSYGLKLQRNMNGQQLK